MARQLTDVDLGVLKEALKGEIHHAAEKRYLHRLHCVLLVSAGQECSSVANWFGESSRSVERWVDSYYEFGPLGLKDDDKSGRLASLDADQFQFLLREIAVTPECLGYSVSRWSGKLLQQHLQKHYQVDLGLRQCQRILRELKNSCG
ncbi:helix-turn-helix domain-containing protein [endosymbiont of Riftia pachyptila]|nr:helix-turn-helix domain-containing protein [endosymbiont of Riftia pachyptila]